MAVKLSFNNALLLQKRFPYVKVYYDIMEPARLGKGSDFQWVSSYGEIGNKDLGWIYKREYDPSSMEEYYVYMSNDEYRYFFKNGVLVEKDPVKEAEEIRIKEEKRKKEKILLIKKIDKIDKILSNKKDILINKNESLLTKLLRIERNIKKIKPENKYIFGVTVKKV